MTMRSGVLALAFAAIVGAAITGATLRGETRETSLQESCAFAVWPEIPAPCLDGGSDRAVRMIPIESPAVRAMNHRFAAAFVGGSDG